MAALVLAVGLAVMGTILGARLHSEYAFSGEGGRPVYPEYGWPWGWKTDAPRSVIEGSDDGAQWEWARYDENGYAGGIFLMTTAMWFVAALVAEALLGAVAHCARLLWRKVAGSPGRSNPSAGLPP